MTPQLGDPGKAAELLAQILAMEHVSKFDFSIIRESGPVNYYEWTAVVRSEKYGNRLQVFRQDPGSTPAQQVVNLLRIAVRTLEMLA